MMSTSSIWAERVIGYYTNWAQYRPTPRKYMVENIDPTLYTNLVYAFADIQYDKDSQGKPNVTSLNFRLTPLEWNDWQASGSSNYKAIMTLKKNHPNLKISISVGGWNFNDPYYTQLATQGGKTAAWIFTTIASTTQNRAAFIRSAIDFCRQYGFDGIDIDWEYPGDLSRNAILNADGSITPAQSNNDHINYALLLSEMRQAFHAESIQTGNPELLLSVAVAAGISSTSGYNLSAISSSVDWIGLMTYDYHGGWEAHTGATVPLYRDSQPNGTLSIQDTFTYYSSYVPAQKLVLGVGTYARGWAGVSSPTFNAVASGNSPKGSYLLEDGVFAYFDINDLIQGKGYTRYWDALTGTPFVYNSTDHVLVSYDDPQSVGLKAQFAKDHGMGGTMTWALDTDSFLSTDPVQNALQKAIVSVFPVMQSAPAAYIPPYLRTYSVRGYVKQGTTPLSGVTVILEGNTTGWYYQSKVTDSSGYYIIDNIPYNLSINALHTIKYGTVQTSIPPTFSFVVSNNIQANFNTNPSLTGWSIFTPSTQPDTPPINTYKVCGTITAAGGKGNGNIQIILKNHTNGSAFTALTDSTGYFEFGSVSANASITVTPTSNRYTFSPTNVPIASLAGNATLTFSKIATTYIVSGNIKNGAAPVSGVSVLLVNETNGNSVTAVTDSNGQFSFATVSANATIRVTPSLNPFLFYPAFTRIVQLSEDMTLGFFKIATTYAVSGTLTRGSSMLSGIAMTLRNETSGQTVTAFTDSSGHFTFSAVSSNVMFTLTPTSNTYVFLPSSVRFGPLLQDTVRSFLGEPSQDVKCIAYYAGWDSRMPSSLPATSLTHINYAFAAIASDYTLSAPSSGDLAKFAQLRQLKLDHPGLQTIISIGGADATQTARFISLSRSATDRQRFADACVAFMVQHGFDGIDIDWEFPASGDTSYYTLLIQALRDALTTRSSLDNQYHFLTTALSFAKENIDYLDIPAIIGNLDWINNMSYDIYMGWQTFSGHNSPLYRNNAMPQWWGANSAYSVDESVAYFMSKGVPAKKMVIGGAFYGREQSNVPAGNSHGLFQTRPIGTDATPLYSEIVNTYLTNNGYVHYWDDTSKVPWLYNATMQKFLSYDDEESIRLKARYAKDQHLGGMMTWHIGGDDSQYTLTKAIYSELSSSTNVPVPPVLSTPFLFWEIF